MERETLADGTLRLSTGGVEVTLQRLRPGVFLVVYRGYDTGSVSDEVLAHLEAEDARDVFVDGDASDGVTTAVRETWTQWMQAHRDRTRLTLLVSSRFMQVTVNVAKHLAGMDRMVIVSDRQKFDAAVAAARRDQR